MWNREVFGRIGHSRISLTKELGVLDLEESRDMNPADRRLKGVSTHKLWDISHMEEVFWG